MSEAGSEDTEGSEDAESSKTDSSVPRPRDETAEEKKVGLIAFKFFLQ